MKRTALLIFIIIISVSNVFAQKTTEAFGIEFLNSLKSEDLDTVKKLIPKAETLIEYSKSVGLEQTESDIESFLEKYPAEVKQFINKLNNFKSQAEKKGINWKSVEFVEVQTELLKELMPELDKTLELTKINVVFNNDGKLYKLILFPVFEFNNIWYLGGETPILEEQ